MEVIHKITHKGKDYHTLQSMQSLLNATATTVYNYTKTGLIEIIMLGDFRLFHYTGKPRPKTGRPKNKA